MPTAPETKSKAVDASAAGGFLSNLEKYHVAGQGYMAAPRAPESDDLGLIVERDAQYERDRVRNVKGRIGAEEALRLAGKAGKSAGGYYYPVTEEDDDEEEAEKKKAVVSKPLTK